ncbi:MAG: hypothetical protein RLZZ579_1138, partial [Actinomycetota bacterium]
SKYLAIRLVDVTELRIALAQTNPRVGDYAGNSEVIREFIASAAKSGSDLVVFGELALTGYPPGDLAFRSDVLESADQALRSIVEYSRGFPGLTVVLGHIRKAATSSHWAKAHNSATVFRNGIVLGTYDKRELPNYDIFDDVRIFIPGTEELIFDVNGTKCAVMICEDIWRPGSRLSALKEAGVELVVSPNGSPWESGKPEKRYEVSKAFTSQGLALAYVNLVCGQDDLVFDGNSFLISGSGKIEITGKSFEVDLAISDAKAASKEEQGELQQIFNAIKLGITDYVKKTGHKGVVVGLSGGIDSALVATLAVLSLGKDNVIGVRMPSRFSSKHSLQDAQDLADRLEIDLRTHEIDGAHKAFEQTLDLSPIAGENIQARIRAVILMAVSNNENLLVLNTGNKSEVAVGYSTIYGDSIGAYAPLKDLYKTDVWRLAAWINKQMDSELIPESSIMKAPSAELRPDQVDTDSLPEYQVLDAILRQLIEEHATISEVVNLGFDKELVMRVDKMVRAAEWKRSQAPIGPRLSKVSFGRGRRVPLATKFGDLS